MRTGKEGLRHCLGLPVMIAKLLLGTATLPSCLDTLVSLVLVGQFLTSLAGLQCKTGPLDCPLTRLKCRVAGSVETVLRMGTNFARSEKSKKAQHHSSLKHHPVVRQRL